MAISKRLAMGLTTGALIVGTLVGWRVTENKGLPELYGDDPFMSYPANGSPFQEEFRTVVYMKFADNNGAWTIRHAPYVANADIKSAIICLKRGADRCRENGIGRIISYVDPQNDNVIPIHEDLNDLYFSSRQKIYIYIDDNNFGFQEKTPISFTPYGAYEPVAWTKSDSQKVPHEARPKTRDPNRTFYNLKLETVSGYGEGTKILSFENHYRNFDGGVLTRPTPSSGPPDLKSRLSMNINLMRCKTPTCDVYSGGMPTIPFIIDPDTGNGYGYAPPRPN